MSLLTIITIVLLIVAPVYAQQSASPADYPTVAALEQAVVPPADYVALAQRFRGVGVIPPPPTSAPVRQLGEQQAFWVSDDQHEFQIMATLRVIGKHIYFWVENGAQVNDNDLQTLADSFDNNIYDAVRGLWGSEANPGIDGDARVYGLFAHHLGATVGAYFLRRHDYPEQVFPHSNQHEMFFFNLDSISSIAGAPDLQDTIAHEFQHMIRANIHPNTASWMDEGFSMFTELYLYQNPGFINNFLTVPQVQLNTWSSDQFSLAHYGAATLFIDYLYERCGIDAIHALSADPGVGLNAFDDVLKRLGKPGVNDFFADWALANGLMKPDTDYGYRLLDAGTPRANPLNIVGSYPFNTSGTANQYAADYIVLTNLSGKTSLDISLNTPNTVSLLPTQAASGRWMWYSNRGDSSDTTLTHSFDLSAVQKATLNYRAWYSIEDSWDYGYVAVSTDDGATWTALSTAHTTDANPQSTAYGSGYTGNSSDWIAESVPLDVYAGKTILVRFEMITDDAVNLPGLAIDDVSIPEIGYGSDFEADGGGWEAAGWVRTDNRLPEAVWVQAVQQMGKQVQVSRWLAPAENHWTLPLANGVQQVLIAISPFAPVTTVPTTYTLSVNAQ